MTKPQLVFLDIHMPDLDGLGVAETLVRSDAPPSIVFVTAFDQYAVKAFEVNALDYLLKPYDRDRFEQALTGRAQSLDTQSRNGPTRRHARPNSQGRTVRPTPAHPQRRAFVLRRHARDHASRVGRQQRRRPHRARRSRAARDARIARKRDSIPRSSRAFIARTSSTSTRSLKSIRGSTGTTRFSCATEPRSVEPPLRLQTSRLLK